jgi:hypothetical protein
VYPFVDEAAEEAFTGIQPSIFFRFYPPFGFGLRRVHRGTQGYTGVHKGTQEHTGVHSGGYPGVPRGTHGDTGVPRGTPGYTGVHRGTQCCAPSSSALVTNCGVVPVSNVPLLTWPVIALTMKLRFLPRNRKESSICFSRRSTSRSSSAPFFASSSTFSSFSSTLAAAAASPLAAVCAFCRVALNFSSAARHLVCLPWKAFKDSS